MNVEAEKGCLAQKTQAIWSAWGAIRWKRDLHFRDASALRLLHPA
jgi:hypothetical protein